MVLIFDLYESTGCALKENQMWLFFLNTGVMKALAYHAGTEPVDNENFTISVKKVMVESLLCPILRLYSIDTFDGCS